MNLRLTKNLRVLAAVLVLSGLFIWALGLGGYLRTTQNTGNLLVSILADELRGLPIEDGTLILEKHPPAQGRIARTSMYAVKKYQTGNRIASISDNGESDGFWYWLETDSQYAPIMDAIHSGRTTIVTPGSSCYAYMLARATRMAIFLKKNEECEEM